MTQPATPEAIPNPTLEPEEVPPHYPETPVVRSLAYGHSLALPKTLFTGMREESRPAFIWILTIEPVSAEDETLPTLILSPGTPQARALKPGDVVAAEHFDQLHWEGAHNAGGRFSFAALNEAQEPFDQLEPQHIVIEQTASPPTPVYPVNQAPHPVAHDGELRIAPVSFSGTVDERAPAAIRITRLVEHERTDHSPSALRLHHDDGTETPLKTGDIVRAEDFGRVHWHTATNVGGAFDFVPLTEDDKPIRAAGTQHIDVLEHPLPPVYAEQRGTIGVAHDQSRIIEPSVFEGTDPARRPAGVRITAIEAANPQDDAPSPLLFGDEAVPVSAGFFLRADDFGKLRWSTAGNEGGHFSFEAANADGTPILGSAVQHVPIHESPLPPDYGSRALQKIPHDQTTPLAVIWFEGDDPPRKPAYIQIMDIQATDHATTAPSPLFRQQDGQRMPVEAGDRLASSLFDQLRWDASTSGGGRVRFQALDSEQRPIEGASSRTLELMELSPPPGYGLGYANIVPVAHDALVSLPETLFAGVLPDQRPPAIQILDVKPKDSTADDAAALLLDPDGPTGPLTPTQVKPGQIIRSAEFDQLYWDSRHNHGGRLHFQPLHADDTPNRGAIDPKLSIHESPVPPVFPNPGFTLPTAHDDLFALDLRKIYPENKTSEHAYLRIVAIEARHTTAPDAPVVYNGDYGYTNRPLKTGDIVPFSSGGRRLVWDSRTNDGGEITLEVLDQARQPVADSPLLRLNVVESPPLPAYQPELHNRNVFPMEEQGRVNFEREVFSGEQSSLAPAFIKITGLSYSFAKQSPLVLRFGQAGEQILVRGSIVAQADFEHISWDERTNLGGNFSFIPLDAQQQPYASQSQQHVLVFRLFAKPVYADPAPDVTVGHDQSIALARELFSGEGPVHTSPSYIRITAIDPIAPIAGQSPLVLDIDGPGGNAPRALQVGDFIFRNHFDKLSWQADGNDGGSFSFRVYESDHETRLNPSVPERTITIREEAPDSADPSSGAAPGTPPDPQTLPHAGIRAPADMNGQYNPLSETPNAHALMRSWTPLPETDLPPF
ncbi:MAG: hypothetical protein Q4B17_11815 [Lautropia sp.]|nr:hypothetical protein [Lautropia sp.]